MRLAIKLVYSLAYIVLASRRVCIIDLDPRLHCSKDTADTVQVWHAVRHKPF